MKVHNEHTFPYFEHGTNGNRPCLCRVLLFQDGRKAKIDYLKKCSLESLCFKVFPLLVISWFVICKHNKKVEHFLDLNLLQYVYFNMGEKRGWIFEKMFVISIKIYRLLESWCFKVVFLLNRSWFDIYKHNQKKSSTPWNWTSNLWIRVDSWNLYKTLETRIQ